MPMMSLARLKVRRQYSGIIYFAIVSLSVDCNWLYDYPWRVQNVKCLFASQLNFVPMLTVLKQIFLDFIIKDLI